MGRGEGLAHADALQDENTRGELEVGRKTGVPILPLRPVCHGVTNKKKVKSNNNTFSAFHRRGKLSCFQCGSYILNVYLNLKQKRKGNVTGVMRADG